MKSCSLKKLGRGLLLEGGITSGSGTNNPGDDPDSRRPDTKFVTNSVDGFKNVSDFWVKTPSIWSMTTFALINEFSESVLNKLYTKSAKKMQHEK